MNQLKSIFKSNSFMQNMSWFGNIILGMILIAYYLIKDLWNKTDKK